MAKTCIKCGYTRGDSETAPDYECPSCGVVYAKAEAAHARLAQVKERASAMAAAQAPEPAAAAAQPAGDARAAALMRQVLIAQRAASRGPSPYRGIALVALVAFAVGFASAAALYSGAARINSKATAAAAAACQK